MITSKASHDSMKKFWTKPKILPTENRLSLWDIYMLPELIFLLMILPSVLSWAELKVCLSIHWQKKPIIGRWVISTNHRLLAEISMFVTPEVRFRCLFQKLIIHIRWL